jgi:hypothetical protein
MLAINYNYVEYRLGVEDMKGSMELAEYGGGVV